MRVDYELVDVEASDDNTRIFHVFEMRIGINEFDQRIFLKCILNIWKIPV